MGEEKIKIFLITLSIVVNVLAALNNRTNVKNILPLRIPK